ncbi:odorant receptor 45b-like [Formica exsecta]|uniref:odorant receptor 45b-like n=1 Tax=Formica exsecta TaxID=72781 RepID=UPI0011449787|nr:odorant receptor 45b-like [Formica exsecta]
MLLLNQRKAVIFYLKLEFLLDLSYAFALSRQCLRLLGVWPDPRIPLSNLRRPNITFITVMFILSFYIVIPQFIHVIRVWSNVALMVEDIAAANFSLMALSKLFVTWYHSETLRTLMMSVMTDWINSTNKCERSTMLRFARRGRNLSFGCYALATITLVFYICFNLLKLYQNNHQPQRSLIYHFVYPYNAQKSPNYEITFVIQLFGGIYAALINATVDSFISMLLLHECAQLLNLRMALNDLIDELANKSISYTKFKEGLAAIAIRHKHLIRTVKTINNCYSAVLFVYMLTTTFQLCFQTFRTYTIITDKLNVSVFKVAFLSLYVVSLLTNLYMYCYAAEKVLTESTSVAYSVYESKWYNIPAKDAKNLMIIAYGSIIPLNLTAGKFGNFSMELLGSNHRQCADYRNTKCSSITGI